MIRQHSEVSGIELKKQMRQNEICFGRNVKLRIYGKLNCRSRRRRMEKENGMFFPSEQESLLQSYRLCTICYAIASLSCTLPIFLLVVFQGLSTGGIAEGSIVFLMYALGMGSVMIAISLAVTLSDQTFVKWLRRLTPKMNFITSILLIMAGSYLIYYNLIIGKLLSSL
jgi:cytochrome c biogenesis protein CcdA